MSEGWSIRVTPGNVGTGLYPVEWYIAAVPDKAAAIAAVHKTINRPDASVEAVQKLPIAFLQSRQLKPGEVAYLYRRGVSRRRGLARSQSG